jgi:UPF0755 protein
VQEGETLRDIAHSLYTNNYIRSPLLFIFFVRTAKADVVIRAGNYEFTEPLSTYNLIKVLAHGGVSEPLRTLTFPEGFRIADMHKYTEGLYGDISLDTYLPYEGYLFPETYFVSEKETFDDLISRMKMEYETKIMPFRADIEKTNLSERDVITLASILEREANDETSMRLVSGILQNRLRENLPLQVDATFAYTLGKTSDELTIDDLTTDSPYNTYTKTGLPPSPIANPGLLAISAVLSPTPTDYFYYLTGNEGTFYYAKTFEEHKMNKAKYLR